MNIARLWSWHQRCKRTGELRDAKGTQSKRCGAQSFSFTKLAGMFLLLFLMNMVLALPSAQAATTLSAGDLAIVRMNEDSPSDGFSFVTLVAIDAGTEIYFTDEGWLGPSWNGNDESHLKYTAPAGGLSAGSVVHIDETATDNVLSISGAGGSISFAWGTSVFNLSGGDQILVYQTTATSKPSSPTFIAGLTMNDGNSSSEPNDPTTGWTSTDAYTTTGVNVCRLPNGLTNGVNCISVFPDYTVLTEKDNARYNCTLTTGTKSALLAAINNHANWSYDDAANYATSTVCSFTVTSDSPEINVLGNGSSIVDGDTTPATSDHTDFGSVAVVGGTMVRTFTIQNTGSGSLILSGTPVIAVSGVNSGDFTVTMQPASPVAASGSTTFQVTFDPSGTGTRTASISIANNDADENPYNFSIQGTGITSPPSISVVSPISGLGTGGTSIIITGTNLTGASAVKFGSTDALSFTIASDTQITATSPAHSVGAVHITVTTTGGTSTASSSDQYSFLPQVVYAKPDGLVNGFCDSWANGCELRFALANAINGQDIWAKAGSYTPTSGTDRAATFQLVSGVALYGGFSGSETLRTQRDPAANVTILSGDLLKDDGTNFNNRIDNSIHVVTGANSAILDGFTISGGNADGSEPEDPDMFGGGMLNNNASPTVRNCIFTGNMAGVGAGMGNYLGSAPTVVNCTFSNNLTDSGGGICNYVSSPTVTGCTFTGNHGSDGGAMLNAYSSNPTVTNCTFSSNQANKGGAISNVESSPTITNSTFSGNTANSSGGAIYNEFSTPTISNSILWGNYGGEIFNYGTETPTVSYSVVLGGYAGTGNINADPLLAPFGSYGGATQTFALLPGSPAIDVVNPATCAATDQRGISRPQLGNCDIGAFESQGFTLTKTDGDNQSAAINSAFALPLALSVTANNAGEPVNGGVITFSSPDSGASTNPASTSAIITNGAVSKIITANSILGSYSVTAATNGSSNVSYSLANILPATTSLTVTISGSGSVTSNNQTGTNYTCNSGSCAPVTFNQGDSVTLNATGSNSSFSSWSGDYSGSTNPGSITMNDNKAVTASFTPDPAKVKIDGSETSYYSINSALAAPTQDATIRAKDTNFAENVVMDNSHNLTLEGGYSDSNFSSQTGYSSISGSLTIKSGKLIVDRVKIGP